MFRSATLKLTAWYLLIIMLISITFSVVIYNVSSTELNRPLTGVINGQQRMTFNLDEFEANRRVLVSESRERLVLNLVIVNLVTLALGGGASYLLARRTLRPIQEAMDTQGRFTSDASHELRTPLAAMQSEIEVALRDKDVTKSQMKTLLKSNLEEVHKLRGLSDRLLQLTSEKHISLEPTSLEEVAIAATNQMITAAQAKQISIDNTVSDITVQGNADYLADLLDILLDNAIKYSPPETTVTLSTEQHGRHVYLSVADHGVGIKETDQQHIFDRFYRADTSRSKTAAPGYGLGLPIAQRIAELHGGSIDVESTRGKGSEFTVKIPVA